MDFIGNIEVPVIAASGVFPLTVAFPDTFDRQPTIHTHQFGSANRKITQRFLAGVGPRKCTFQKHLSEAERISLRDFWEARKGPYQPFTFAWPSNDRTTTNTIARFSQDPLSWELLMAAVSRTGITLIEVPDEAEAPVFEIEETVERFPSAGLATALLSQVQDLIPWVKIQSMEAGYPEIFLSDRRCTIGEQLYQARLLSWSGISQSLDGAGDEATFTFGNADRVMRDLAADTNLEQAIISFGFFRKSSSSSGVKIDFWKGELTSYRQKGPEFSIQASDLLSAITQQDPLRIIDRGCYKEFNDGKDCPAATAGGLHLGDECDRGFATPLGCTYHNMQSYFGGIPASPQGVYIRNNAERGRPYFTASSQVADTIYGEVLQEVYTDIPLAVECQIAASRDESGYVDTLGIVSLGPISSYGDGHTLDGSLNHGPGNLGLRRSYGHDPVQDNDPDSGSQWFSLGQGNPTVYGLEKAAAVAFLELRRRDAEGVQLQKITDRKMIAYVTGGLSGFAWTDVGTRVVVTSLTNPVWMAVNKWLRARGVYAADAATQAATFSVQAAIDAAAICNTIVDKIVGDAGTEKQFAFQGVLRNRRVVKEQLEAILLNCLGNFTFVNGKLKITIRSNASAVEAFTAGNIILNSLELESIQAEFNSLRAAFTNAEWLDENGKPLWQKDSVALNDFLDYGRIKKWKQAEMELMGAATKSRASRIVITKLREELGGLTAAERKKARRGAFKTTILALNTEPGQVISITDEEIPGGAGNFRIQGWRLNPDYSIDISIKTVTASMYDMTVGPKPADVTPDPVPAETILDVNVPGALSFTTWVYELGYLTIDEVAIAGGLNTKSLIALTANLAYIDERTLDLWATLDADLGAVTDPASVAVTLNPGQVTDAVFANGDLVLFWHDENFEIGRLTAGAGTGTWTIARHPAGAGAGEAEFESLLAAHPAGTKIYKVEMRRFDVGNHEGNWDSDTDIAPRFDLAIPNVIVVAVNAATRNGFGYSPFTTVNCATADFPGLRTQATGIPADPNPPTGVTVAILDGGDQRFGLRLSWTPPGVLLGTVGYDQQVRYFSDALGIIPESDWISLGPVTGGATATADSGYWPRPPATQYVSGRVRAVNSEGTSTAWVTSAALATLNPNANIAPPNPPTGVAIAVLTGTGRRFGVRVTWTPPGTPGGAVSYDFEVRYFSDSGGSTPASDWIAVGSLSDVAATTADFGYWQRPPADQWVKARMRAVNGVGEVTTWVESAALAEVDDLAPNPPTGVTAAVVAVAEPKKYVIRLTWTAPSPIGGTVGYRLGVRFYNDSGGSDPDHPAVIVLGDVDGTLITADMGPYERAAKQQWIRGYVAGKTSDEALSSYAASGGALVAVPIAATPGLPTGLSVTVVDLDDVNYLIRMDWTPPSPVGSAVEYDREVQFYDAADGSGTPSEWIPLGPIPSIALATQDAGPYSRVDHDQWIKVRLRTRNVDNTASAWVTTTLPASNTLVSALVSAAAPAAESPSAATITVTSSGDRFGLTFEWDLPGDTGGTIGYEVAVRYFNDAGETDPDSDWMVFPVKYGASLDSSQDGFWPRPPADQWVRGRVRAINADGSPSAWVDTSNLEPLASAPPASGIVGNYYAAHTLASSSTEIDEPAEAAAAPTGTHLAILITQSGTANSNQQITWSAAFQSGTSTEITPGANARTLFVFLKVGSEWTLMMQRMNA